MNLRCLLKRDNQRKLLLIETLYYAKYPMTGDQLRQIVDCTVPILISDIRSINSTMEYYEISRENGLYSLEVADNATIDALFSTMIRDSLPFKILELIFFEEYETLQEISADLYCSLSSVQKHMTILMDVLKKWQLTIHRRPFRIAGNEKNIRQLFFLLFSEKKVQKNELRYSTEFFDRGEAVIRSMIKNNQLECSYTQYNRLCMMFFISLERVKHGHFFSKRFLGSKHLLPPDWITSYQFAESLLEEVGMEYTDDVMRESFWLLYADLFLLGEAQKKKALESNYALAYSYSKHQELVEEFNDLLVVPLRDEQKNRLTSILINQHLFLAETPEYISVLRDGKRDYINLLENFHAHCVHDIRSLVQNFTQKHRIFESDEFINNYVYQIIAAVPECLTGMKQLTEPVNILIVASDSTTQEQLLTQLIYSSVRGDYFISHITMSQLDSVDIATVFSRYDLVICTLTLDLPHCPTPILAVELCPSIYTLNKLQRWVEDIYQKKKRARKASQVS
ncbi:helix-turn-helix domain-containing protein [Enterococcus sp. 669A]|uniref:Helix-turn-helix domain-containing protein n=1 Tax=Candidatus Enterococcus moelleringii TaxID=2815325 RepID=A0ABS3L6A0_9ENTE|nr:helix-turn-helix domain-containing protein [Enterococcus sp. 669A]MBO1304620.1 helix-turn-helix domain-containing protein [Enterococcus sp. 669A]